METNDDSCGLEDFDRMTKIGRKSGYDRQDGKRPPLLLILDVWAAWLVDSVLVGYSVQLINNPRDTATRLTTSFDWRS